MQEEDQCDFYTVLVLKDPRVFFHESATGRSRAGLIAGLIKDTNGSGSVPAFVWYINKNA